MNINAINAKYKDKKKNNILTLKVINNSRRDTLTTNIDGPSPIGFSPSKRFPHTKFI